MRRMTPKTIQRWAVLFLIGCAVNLLIAWGVALVIMPDVLVDAPGSPVDSTAPSVWSRFRKADWPDQPDEVTRIRGIVFTAIQAYARDPFVVIAVEGRYGFPFKSLSFHFWGGGASGGHYESTLPADRTVQFMLGDPGQLLPAHPIWWGIVLNGVFYGVIIELFLARRSHKKRKRRLARHLCPECCYPIIEWKVCPECGFDLSSVRTWASAARGQGRPELDAKERIAAYLAAERLHKFKKQCGLYGLWSACVLSCIIVAAWFPNPVTITLAAAMSIAFCVSIPFWRRSMRRLAREVRADRERAKE